MINKSFAIILIFLISGLLNASVVFGREGTCSKVKHSIKKRTIRLLDLIDSVESCSEPAQSFRDKVFSNLKYRSGRLKKCIKMVQEGKFGFDCSRELRKTLRSQGGEKCADQLESMKSDFKSFLDLSLEYKACLGI